MSKRLSACILHCGIAERECKVEKNLRKNGFHQFTTKENLPSSLEDGDVARAKFSALEPPCSKIYSEFPPLGRFVIEGEKGAAAIGIVLEIDKSC